MDWREEYKSKLVSAEEAVRVVKSGDRVVLPLGNQTKVLGYKLFERSHELENVEIVSGTATNYGWFDPGYEKCFYPNIETYTGPGPRDMLLERRGDFTPNIFGRMFKALDEGRPGVRPPDVVIVPLSTPDEHGYCSFGHDLWAKKDYIQRAKKRGKLVIGEVDDHLIRTFGDNFIPVSEIDYFVDVTPQWPTPEEYQALLAKSPPELLDDYKLIFRVLDPGQVATRGELIMDTDPTYIKNLLGLGPPIESTKAIAGYVSTLLRDGDVIQIGVGEVSTGMVKSGLFEGRYNLSLHTEIAPTDTAKMVDAGIFTGDSHPFHPGKIIATSFWPSADQEDLAIVNGNPKFELHSTTYVQTARNIMQIDNMVAINNALIVDLAGQIGFETLPGFRLENGPGGQIDFQIGAMYSRGGRAISLLPSTAMGGAVSRIVPLIEDGALVDIPRPLADFIVTEYGIASMQGKSQRQRAEELIAIAHPDFRAELRKEAQRMLYPVS